MADSKLKVEYDDIKIKIERWETSFLGEDISFWVIIYKDEFYFFGKELGKALGFKKPIETFMTHTDPEDITTLKDLLGDNFKSIIKRNLQGDHEIWAPCFFQNLQPHQKLFNEFSLYATCLGSKLKPLKPFRRWVYQTIKTIRKTGSYISPNGPFNNPLEIIHQVIIPQIPKYDKDTKNLERKAICRALKEAYDNAKHPPYVRGGRKGGLKTQKDIRELKDSFYKLKRKVNDYIEKYEKELKTVLEEISSESERRSSSSDSE